MAHQINTPSGPIIAHELRDLLYAKGIPYATAKRFGKPSPIQPWTSAFDASNPSPACPQVKDEAGEMILRQPILEGLDVSEDCLRVSIVCPMPPTNAASVEITKLPVMAWIHGGAYLTGAADAGLHDPSPLVREQGIIVVKINYRLGLLGYIGDGSDSRPANLGLLDQLAALRWIQENIGAFGGDPQNVTVAGQSAGADAIVHLLATKDAPRLFRRAIIQSAPLGLRAGREKMLEAIVRFTKDLSPNQPVEEVLDMTRKALASVRRYGLIAGLSIATQYGLDPLPDEDKLEEIWSRNMKSIDVLIGSTKDEAAMFRGVVPVLGAIFAIPAVGGWIETKVVRYLTRKMFEDGTIQFANLLGKSGRTWLYDFFWQIPGNKYRSAHAIDLALQFGEREIYEKSAFLDGGKWEEVDERGKQFRQLLGRFVKGEDLGEQGEIEGVLRYKKI